MRSMVEGAGHTPRFPRRPACEGHRRPEAQAKQAAALQVVESWEAFQRGRAPCPGARRFTACISPPSPATLPLTFVVSNV
jgi:hypothetical protein